MSIRFAQLASLATISAVMVNLSNVATAAEENFYKGKTVSLVVGFSAGGGFDAYARLLANHMGRHIAGQPNFIVKNMPGASSLKAVKFLTLTARNDGTVMTLHNPGVVTKSLTDAKSVDVDFAKIRYVGSIASDVHVCYFRKAAQIESLEDLLKRDRVPMGATSVRATAFVNASLLRTQFGAKIQHVTGYPGSAEQRIALERGEIDGMCGSWSSIPVAWVNEKKIVPIVRFAKTIMSGMTPVPYILDLAKSTEKKQIIRLVLAPLEFGRPVAMGPEVPDSLLKIMRTAFNATMKDGKFLADAEKQKREIVGPMTGEEVEATIKELYATPKEIIAKAAQATSPGKSVEKIKR
jgi:tripartite-type tricarboxylate transporter receptor subunit TctC